jgi:hypothetical protein
MTNREVEQGYDGVMDVRIEAVIAVVLLACGGDRSGEREDPAPIAALSVPDAAPVDAMLADAMPADALTSALHLPRHDVDATKVIWRTRAEVQKVLGAGRAQKNGRWRHELGDGEFADVVYDRGMAVGVEIPTATAGWGNFDDGQKRALAAWGHVLHDPDIRGRHAISGEGFPSTGLAVYEEGYWKRENEKIVAAVRAADAKKEAERRAAEAKAERARQHDAARAAERERLMRPAREGFVERFAEMQESSGLPFSFKLGSSDTTLSVVVDGGRCSEALLTKIVETAEDHIRNVGFTRVECASDESISVRP